MADVDVRKGMPSVTLTKDEFAQRFRDRFRDPAFSNLSDSLQALIDAAWDGYHHSRKSPLTREAGPGFADPHYEIALDWLAARDEIHKAQSRHDNPAETPRILIINGSPRSEHTCPGEMSKTWRMVEWATPIFRDMDLAADVLDLSRLTSEFGKTIHSSGRRRAGERSHSASDRDGRKMHPRIPRGQPRRDNPLARGPRPEPLR
jgi:hypothetical protein